jgi:hypothetical protein
VSPLLVLAVILNARSTSIWVYMRMPVGLMLDAAIYPIGACVCVCVCGFGSVKSGCKQKIRSRKIWSSKVSSRLPPACSRTLIRVGAEALDQTTCLPHSDLDSRILWGHKGHICWTFNVHAHASPAMCKRDNMCGVACVVESGATLPAHVHTFNRHDTTHGVTSYTYHTTLLKP